MQGKLKSERHHWWPECVSAHWKNDKGLTNRITPNGEVIEAPPANFGVIGNGHFIKLSKDPADTTPWDQNFEPVFQKADNYFPSVIRWLQSLDRNHQNDARTVEERFMPVDASDEKVSQMVECIVSLAIRSPKNREAAVSVAEQFRGPLPKRERNALIAINMRDSQKQVVSSIGTRGKFAVLYSPDQEFIYGDGFFHNIKSPVNSFFHPKLVAPITPDISVVYTRPLAYITEPRLSTFILTSEETIELNDTVQIYSKNELFYRSQKPNLIKEFLSGKHLEFSDRQNSVEQLIASLPGLDEERSFRDQLMRGTFF